MASKLLKKAKQSKVNKGRSKESIKADSARKAKKAGKRISASGNVYYENRPNRIDVYPSVKL